MNPPDTDYFGRFVQLSTETPRVLLVDDDADVCAALRDWSHQFNLELDTAYDGIQALGFYESRDYRGILLDLRLPGVSGVEVFKHIRQQNRDIPIGIISGGIPQEIIEDLLCYGRFTHLPKPFQAGLLDLRGWLTAIGVKEVQRA